MRSWSGVDTLIPGRGSVNTHWLSGFAVTRFETGVVVGGHVPIAAHDIVDMLAVDISICALAASDAKFSGRHEVSPLVNLTTRAEDVRVDQSTNGVTVSIGTVVIHLSTIITSYDVDLGEVALTGNLNVVGSLDEVDTSEGSRRHDARSVTRLGAIRDSNTFRVSNSIDGRW